LKSSGKDFLYDKKDQLNSQYDKLLNKNTDFQKGPFSSNEFVNPSLLSFLKGEPLNHWLRSLLDSGPWCELGSGPYSLFEVGEELIPGLGFKNDLMAFDLSNSAIESSPSEKIKYKVQDITKGLPLGPYAFILDGHFLHCLSSLPELFQTLGMIFNALKPGGLFAGEVMMAHKNLSFDHDLFYDFDTNVLSFEGRPLRVILWAHEWEQLFIEAGFKIEFFICQSSIKMIPGRKRRIPMSGDPECLRFVLKRPS